jgi:hypothetical protein
LANKYINQSKEWIEKEKEKLQKKIDKAKDDLIKFTESKKK